MPSTMTDYFYQVIQNTKHPVIPFKDNAFATFSCEEIRRDYFTVDKTDEICCLLDEYESELLFSTLSEEEKNKKTYPIVKKFSCALSYKTLATEFNYGIKKDDIEEMTGIFYIPCDITFSRNRNDTVSVKFGFDQKTLPWFSRAFIEPTCNEHLSIVTSEEKIDAYLKASTEERAKINNWGKYIDYYDVFFNSIANLSLSYEAN